MNNALLSGVSGLKTHQSMLDVAGNNLANVNTTAFKSSRVTFSELLSQTLRPASQPTATIGGTNPMQVGSGVQIGSVDRNMNQGSLISTGQDLDMAIEGDGYFVLNDGAKDTYTRMGAFAVDSQYFLVDPVTGYRVQRIGSEGESEGFQQVSESTIRIPYDVAMPAKPTTSAGYTGNLSANDSEATRSVLSSGIQYLDATSSVISADTRVDDLSGMSGLDATSSLVITGTNKAGTAVDNNGSPILLYDSVAGDFKTMDEICDEISALFSGSTVSIVNGEIRVEDDAAGYSQTDIYMAWGGAGTKPALPAYFKMLSAGGNSTKTTNIEIFDSQGISHIVSGSFVRTDTANQWDFVVNSITGGADVVPAYRRVEGISFLTNGAFAGLAGGGNPQLSFAFAHDPSNPVRISLDLGTIGQFDGLSQFGGSSTVAPSSQDGYASGWLSSLSVSREGVLVGVFTNGIRADIAALKIATFQNPAGMESTGSGYFSPSANSGDAIVTKALGGSAGSVRGGSLEKSNVEVASEFVEMIQAQNGYQANARTITVANEMLRELTNLIR